MSNPRKSKQVSTTISADAHEALEAYRWEARLTMTQLVHEALTEYAVTNGIDLSGEASAE